MSMEATVNTTSSSPTPEQKGFSRDETKTAVFKKRLEKVAEEEKTVSDTDAALKIAQDLLKEKEAENKKAAEDLVKKKAEVELEKQKYEEEKAAKALAEQKLIEEEAANLKAEEVVQENQAEDKATASVIVDTHNVTLKLSISTPKKITTFFSNLLSKKIDPSEIDSYIETTLKAQIPDLDNNALNQFAHKVKPILSKSPSEAELKKAIKIIMINEVAQHLGANQLPETISSQEQANTYASSLREITESRLSKYSPNNKQLTEYLTQAVVKNFTENHYAPVAKYDHDSFKTVFWETIKTLFAGIMKVAIVAGETAAEAAVIGALGSDNGTNIANLLQQDGNNLIKTLETANNSLLPAVSNTLNAISTTLTTTADNVSKITAKTLSLAQMQKLAALKEAHNLTLDISAYITTNDDTTTDDAVVVGGEMNIKIPE